MDDIEEKVEKILGFLNTVKTRCTYKVVAEILGVSAQSVRKHLGERRPEASWVVSSTTGHPSDYKDDEKHPDLYNKKRMITNAEVLRRNLGFEKRARPPV